MSLPLCRKLGLKLASLLILLIYLYVSFIILQLALFNLILLGIMVIYLTKLNNLMRAYTYKHEYNFQIRGLKKFLEE